MLVYSLIALGGALGSVLRYWLGGVVADRADGPFPWGTLLVNVTGSLAIGCFAALTAPETGRWPLSGEARVFVMAGVCGGYTTFSAFSLQTLQLVHGGEWLRAGLYVAASVLVCLIAVWLGHAAGAAFDR